jgi:rhodanese-related sulfurtransferase|tara:strand:+ start:74 stop:382 length:309 start_codon:yes stop_codon:yes gene_type:complete
MDLDQGKWLQKYNETKNSKIIDVRTLQEFKEIRIPDSENIDFYDPQNFIKKITLLDKEASYFLYCKSGTRSYNSCTIMKDMGFKNVYNLVGGISDWNGEVLK